jgi:hypothetical protein
MSYKRKHANPLRCHDIVTYPWSAWLKGPVLDLTIEFVWPPYNLFRQFTNHYLPHCHLFLLDVLNYLLHHDDYYSQLLALELPLLYCFGADLTENTISKNNPACLPLRCLAVDRVILLRARMLRACLPSDCLAMIYDFKNDFHVYIWCI